VPIDAEPAPVRAPAEWEELRDERPDRSWLRPVLLAVVVLALLGILGAGLWLIFNGVGNRPGPAPVIPVTSAGVSGPTQSAPPTEAPTTAPAQVSVPDVVGQSESAARQQLTAQGLTVSVSRRTTSGVNPGTVIATDPGAGQVVDAGAQVTLIVAAAPAPAPTTPSPTPSARPTPSRSTSPAPAGPPAQPAVSMAG
jgi:cytoskeletal protein RodZ